jgi:uncharacterized integral membrane protein (TIGR00698 family)
MEAKYILYVVAALIITLPITTPGYYSSKNFLGIMLCLALAVLSWFLGQLLPIAGGAVIGILFGILLANFWRYPDIFKPGIKDTGKRILQAAVVMLGFQMNFGKVMEMGGQSLILIFVSITAALLTAYFIGKAMGVAYNEKVLIGVGTAICGGSAIAATAPIIKASDKEVVSAISTIFLFNVIAVFVFPFIGNLSGMSDTHFGMWAGAAINDTSSVVTAAYTYSDNAGNVATIVKLTRTLMIIPVTFFLALLQSKKEAASGGFKLQNALPLFVIGFLIASVINTVGVIPVDVVTFWGKMSRFFIVIAMVAIGLCTNLKELVQHGKKPLLLGLCCSVVIAIVSVTLLGSLGIE